MRPFLLLVTFCLVKALAACNSVDLKNTSTVKNKQIDSLVIQTGPVLPQSQPLSGQYCIIRKLYTENGNNFIEADYIQFLMGENAVNTARKRGDAITTRNNNGHLLYSVPDDYYIVNENPAIRKLPLAHGIIVQMANPVDEKSFTSVAAPDQLDKKIKDRIFVLQFEEGKVLRMREQFLP